MKRKESKLYVKWKGYNNSFNSWIDKKRSYKMSHYFRAYRSSGRDIKVELDLSNYATKTEDVRRFASKTNLTSIKTEVDKIHVDKLKTGPVDLAKLGNVVKNDVIRKT